MSTMLEEFRLGNKLLDALYDYYNDFIILRKDGYKVERDWYLDDNIYKVYDDKGVVLSIKTNYSAITSITFNNILPKRYDSNESSKGLDVHWCLKVLDRDKIAEILIELSKTDKIKELFLDNSDESYKFIFNNLCK